MQPGLASLFRAERQQLVVGMFAPTAAEAPAWRRLHQLPVEPFGNAAGEGASLGFFPRQPGFQRPLLEQSCQSSADQPQVPGRNSASTSALCRASAVTTEAGGGAGAVSIRFSPSDTIATPAARASFKAAAGLIAAYSNPDGGQALPRRRLPARRKA